MNDTQKKCYNILLEIDRVCRCAGIKYYLYAGTLLGAVRHNGFIPWDDDIDIVMMRKDYESFPSACRKYMDKDKFILQTIQSDPFANNPWMKLHDKNTAFLSGIRRSGAMEGINIDIFPIDNVPDDENILHNRAKYFDCMNLIYQWRFARVRKNVGWKMKIFQTLIKYIPPWNEKQFKEKYNKKIQEYNSQNTRRVVYFSNRKYMKKVIERSVFDKTVFLTFEERSFPAPAGWEEVLKGLYGENYMKIPPKEQQITVHGTLKLDLEHSWTEYKWSEKGYEKI